MQRRRTKRAERTATAQRATGEKQTDTRCLPTGGRAGTDGGGGPPGPLLGETKREGATEGASLCGGERESGE